MKDSKNSAGDFIRGNSDIRRRAAANQGIENHPIADIADLKTGRIGDAHNVRHCVGSVFLYRRVALRKTADPNGAK